MSMEIVNDIDIRILEVIKEGIQEFSKKLIEEASNYSEFREDLVKTAIALSQNKYRIQNPKALVGIKKDDIDTILFVYNCFNGTNAIIKTKDGQDRIIEFKVLIDEEVKKLTELMRLQYTTLKKRFNKEKEEKEKELRRLEEKYREFKDFMMEVMIEEGKIHYLQDIIFFYGDLKDVKDALEIAKVKGKDVKEIAKAIADIYDPEAVLYALYRVDEEKAKELAKELAIDFNQFKK